MQGPDYLNVLKVTDLPQVLDMLEAARLTRVSVVFTK